MKNGFKIEFHKLEHILEGSRIKWLLLDFWRPKGPINIFSFSCFEEKEKEAEKD